MEKLEITCLSSRGQVVIPQKVRTQMRLHSGEKFVVIGENDVILLKKLEVPSFKGFDKLLQRTRALAKSRGLGAADVAKAVKSVRAR